MKARQSTVGAAEFKARCLSLIDEVHEHKRGQVIITKRGKPVAMLVPVNSTIPPAYGYLKGLATIHGDVTEPTGSW